MSPGLRRLLGRRESGGIAEELEAGRRSVIAEHGEWLAHNVHVGEGVYTRSPALYGDEGKVLRAVQLIEDLVRKPWPELRIADLGANEGLYACEFALRGAAVVAVEGRESNLAKARFAKDSLGLDNLELVKADVRSLSREAHGGFDVVLCWGLLYHLDTPDVFDFVRRMREVCDGVAIVDTHISLSDAALAGVEREMFWADPDALGPMEARTHSGREYWGRSWLEHPEETTVEQRHQAGWASLDNPRSFWFTRPSLVNLLADAGFASVLEAQAPRLAYPPDRVTLLALGSGGQDLRAVPLAEASLTASPVPEQPPRIPR